MRCNFRCRQCDIWKTKYNVDDELSLQDHKKILRSLRKWLGPFRVSFSGGEPFLRPDMVELLRYCGEIGIAAGVVTNGFLIKENLAKEIIDSNPLNINVSLDGFNSDTHDFLRGMPGAHSRAMSALSYFYDFKKKMNARSAIIVKTTIIKQNIEEIVDITKMTKRRGLNGVHFEPLQASLGGENENNPHWYKSNSLWPNDVSLIKEVMQELIKLKKNGFPIINSIENLQLITNYFENPAVKPVARCPVGVRNLGVRYTGEVEQCYRLSPLPIGNIHKQPVAEIWKSDVARQHRSAIRTCRKACLATCHVNRSLADKAKVFFSLFR